MADKTREQQIEDLLEQANRLPGVVELTEIYAQAQRHGGTAVRQTQVVVGHFATGGNVG